MNPSGTCRFAVVFTCSLALAASSGLPLQADDTFRRGDTNGDGTFDISDPMAILGWLFLGGADLSCLDAADSDDNGDIQLTDGIFSLNFLFLGGLEPAAPGPFDCGEDPTDDGLDCVDNGDCPPASPGSPEICDNNIDDDGDGDIDCEDKDCPACPEICDNNLDDDGDGDTDCEDSDCLPCRETGVIVRGYLAAVQDQGRGEGAGAGDEFPIPPEENQTLPSPVFLPGIQVFLRNASTNVEGARVRTDLSGRFTLLATEEARYQVCWAPPGFPAGCSEVFSAGVEPVFLSTLPVSLGTDSTTIYGKVAMADGSLPRTYIPYANVNSFVTVELRGEDDDVLQTSIVNNFGEYLLPQVPGQATIKIHANIENEVFEQTVFPEAGLGQAPLHRYDIRLRNSPPSIAPLYAFDATGRRLKSTLPGSTLSLTAPATDADNDDLRYSWIVESGTVNASDQRDVQWTLPNSIGTQGISVLVYDLRGGYDQRKFSIQTSETGEVKFSGLVDSTAGNAVAGAVVDINGQEATTGSGGYFQLLVRDADRFVFNVRVPLSDSTGDGNVDTGYGLLSRIYTNGITGGRWTLRRATVELFDPTREIRITDSSRRRNCPGPASAQLDWDRFPQLKMPQFQDGAGNVVPPFELDLPLLLPFEVRTDGGPVDPPIPAQGLLGDVNCDGRVNAEDSQALLDHIRTGAELCCFAATDTNGDGVINVQDVVFLNNVLLGAEDPQPVDCGPGVIVDPVDPVDPGGPLVPVDPVDPGDPGGPVIPGEVGDGDGAGEKEPIPPEDQPTFPFPVESLLAALPGGECGPGMTVVIPANSLVDRRGNLPGGQVAVAVSTIDLMTPGQMPGDYTSIGAGGDPSGFMESFGAGSIEITAGDQRFNLRREAQAAVLMPVDRAQLAADAELPGEIPTFFYNEERGVWQEDGFAELAGDAYRARVSHFSQINMDLEIPNPACVEVLSPNMPGTFKLEVIVPRPNAAPHVKTVDIDNVAQQQHVLYNLPPDTNITLVPIRSISQTCSSISSDVPMGLFVVKTGPGTPNNTGTWVGVPAGPPYTTCQTTVILEDQAASSGSTLINGTGEFLNGLFSYEATAFSPQNPLPIPSLQNSLKQMTNAYYAQIDPLGERSDLQGFLTKNGFTFPPISPPSDQTASPPPNEFTVAFGNSGDLGFGREMRCRVTDQANEYTASYVKNHFDGSNPIGSGDGFLLPGGYATCDVQDVIEVATELDAGSPQWALGATVAMEYSPIEGATYPIGDPLAGLPNLEPVVKFYLYVNGLRAQSADLDGLGNRPVPHVCMTCHGGSFPSGPAAPNEVGQVTQFQSDADVRLGSKFLPFDLSLYTFPPDGFFGDKYSKANQQAVFKILNEAIVNISPPATTGPAPSDAIQEVIQAMYANGPTQDEDFLVPGWETPIEDPLRSDMYRHVVAPNCRTCHIASPFAGLLFDDKDHFEAPAFFGGAPTAGAAQVRVCQQHIMPHAKITHDLFWTSSDPHEPSIFELYGREFMQNNANPLNPDDVGWDLTLCQNFGHASTPLSAGFYELNIQPIFEGVGTGTTACVSCHIGSSAPSGLNLTSVPDPSDPLKPISYNRLLNFYLLPSVPMNQQPGGGLWSRISEPIPVLRMPPGPGFPALNTTSMDAIENWILNGAQF